MIAGVRLLLVACILASAAATPGQDPFLAGVLRADEVAVKPKVKVKRLPLVERSKIRSANDRLRLEFVIERDGSVGGVRVADATGDARTFASESVEAIKVWRFEPGLKDGAAARVLAIATIGFKLGQSTGQTPLRPGFDRGPARELGKITLEGVEDDFGVGAVSSDLPGVTLPRLLKQYPPRYPTGQVMKDRVQGTVHVEAILTTKGVIGNVRIVQSVDSRFDTAAIEAARRWTFEPAMKDGQPVAFVLIIEMEFLLYTG
jgi:TonB family protein